MEINGIFICGKVALFLEICAVNIIHCDNVRGDHCGHAEFQVRQDGHFRDLKIRRGPSGQVD